MTAIPKPAKRGPKAKQPIERKTRPAKKRKTKRARLIARADELWSELVKRKGVCEFSPAGSFPEVYPHECWGPHQAQHGISRRKHATRWNLLNGFEGCQRSHYYFGQHQELWGLFLAAAWGPLIAEEMAMIARVNLKPDMESILAYLQAEQEKTDGR